MAGEDHNSINVVSVLEAHATEYEVFMIQGNGLIAEFDHTLKLINMHIRLFAFNESIYFSYLVLVLKQFLNIFLGLFYLQIGLSVKILRLDVAGALGA